MTKSLFIISFSQGRRGPRHWSLFVGESIESKGTLHHFRRPSRDSFVLQYFADRRTPVETSSYRQAIWLANLSDRDVASAEQCFNDLDIHRSSSTGGCQNWCLEAVKALERQDIVENGTLRKIVDNDSFLKSEEWSYRGPPVDLEEDSDSDDEDEDGDGEKEENEDETEDEGGPEATEEHNNDNDNNDSDSDKDDKDDEDENSNDGNNVDDNDDDNDNPDENENEDDDDDEEEDDDEDNDDDDRDDDSDDDSDDSSDDEDSD